MNYDAEVAALMSKAAQLREHCRGQRTVTDGDAKTTWRRRANAMQAVVNSLRGALNA